MDRGSAFLSDAIFDGLTLDFEPNADKSRSKIAHALADFADHILNPLGIDFSLLLQFFKLVIKELLSLNLSIVDGSGDVERSHLLLAERFINSFVEFTLFVFSKEVSLSGSDNFFFIA